MRLDKKLQDCLNLLKKEGINYELIPGSKHMHLRINGTLIGVLHYGQKDLNHRLTKNMVTRINRFVNNNFVKEL